MSSHIGPGVTLCHLVTDKEGPLAQAEAYHKFERKKKKLGQLKPGVTPLENLIAFMQGTVSKQYDF